MFPSNTSVWVCSEIFDVLLIGWERQGQTLVRIVYTEDYEGWGGRKHGNGKRKESWKRCGWWLRYPSAIIPALWFGIRADLNTYKELSSQHRLGWIYLWNMSHTAVKYNILFCAAEKKRINSHVFCTTNFHKMLLTPLNVEWRKHQQNGMKHLIDPEWLEMMWNPGSLRTAVSILGTSSQN